MPNNLHGWLKATACDRSLMRWDLTVLSTGLEHRSQNPAPGTSSSLHPGYPDSNPWLTALASRFASGSSIFAQVLGRHSPPKSRWGSIARTPACLLPSPLLSAQLTVKVVVVFAVRYCGVGLPENPLRRCSGLESFPPPNGNAYKSPLG